MANRPFQPVVPNFLVLLTFVLLLANCSSFAQTIKAYDPDNGAELTGPEYPNKIQFKIDNLQPPPRSSTSNQDPDWEYLWEFGGCSGSSTEKEPIHFYPSEDNSYQVTVTLTPIYSDEDEGDELGIITFPDSGSNDTTFDVAGPFASPSDSEATWPIIEGKSVTIHSVRDCVPGNLATFKVPFANKDTAAIDAGVLTIVYSTNRFTYDPSYLSLCGFDENSHVVDPSNKTGTLTLEYSNLAAGSERVVTISLKTKESTPLGAKIDLYTYLYGDTNLLTEISADTFQTKAVGSYDPNLKSLYQPNLCGNDTFEYMIEFENVGNSFASRVYLVDYVDKHLDMSAFKFLYASHHGVTEPNNFDHSTALDGTFNINFYNLPPGKDAGVIIDSANRKIAFIFNNLTLAGIVPTPTDLDVTIKNKESTGFVIYSMPLKASSTLQYGEQFGTHADIYFDKNEPMSTPPAIATKTPCYCTPSMNSSALEWIDRISLGNLDAHTQNDNGYGNYRDLVATVQAGAPATITLFPGQSLGSGNDLYWKVWIDLNHDGMFGSTEMVVNTFGQGNIISFMTLPPMLPGMTGMRIQMSRDSLITPCNSFLDGEVEDYSVFIEFPNVPDFTILSPQADPVTVLPDSSFQAFCKVHNKGTGISLNPVKIGYYLSADAQWSPGDIFLRDTTLSSIAANAQIPLFADVMVPNQTSLGSTYLLIVADYDNQNFENDEFDNTAFVQIKVDSARADLVINSNYSCPTIQRPGDNIKLTCSIQNKSSKATTAPSLFLTTYLSTDENLDSTDTFLSSTSLGSFSASESKSVEVTLSTSGSLVTGSYHFISIVDEANNLAESSENNNSASTAIEIDNNAYTSIPYLTGFECGTTDAFWKLDASNAAGRTRLTTDISLPNTNQSYLTMDMDNSASSSLNYADLHLNLQNDSNLKLSFDWTDYDDQSNNPDGVFFSDNGGLNFSKVWSLNGSLYTDAQWNLFELDMDSLVNTVGMSYTPTFIVRFQHAGNDSINNDGFGFDNISVEEMPTLKRSFSASPAVSKTSITLWVAPNPAKETATVHYTIASTEDQVSLQIFSVDGQLISEPMRRVPHESGNFTYQIKRNQLKSGLYFCVLRSRTGVASTKIIWLDQ